MTTNDDPISYWLRGTRAAGGPAAGLAGDSVAVDVAIIGAGFTGLWTAIALTDTDPTLAGRRPGGGDRRLRGERSQRRLLRGEPDPRPRERDPALPRRARAPRAGRASTTSRGSIAFTREHDIAATSRRPGTLGLADGAHQVDEFRAWVDEAAEWGEQLEFLDRDAVQAELHSPIWHAALYRPPGRDVAPRPGGPLPRHRPRRARTRRRDPRAHARLEARTRRRWGGSSGPPTARDGPRRSGRGRHLGLLGLAPPAVVALRPRLRLRRSSRTR